jgi:hypothetical protein
MKAHLNLASRKLNHLWFTLALVLAFANAAFADAPSLPTTSGGSVGMTSNSQGDGTAPQQTMQAYIWRNPAYGKFAPDSYGGADVLSQTSGGNQRSSMGPGVVTVVSPYTYTAETPFEVPVGVSTVPTMRDTAITANSIQTNGYWISDEQYQIIGRENNQIFVENLTNPERWMWLTSVAGQMAASNTADSTGATASNQAQNAIEFCRRYLVNFTQDGTNEWNAIRNNLMIPMALLLLLPGAVLAQVRVIIAQGYFSILGELNPFEGILRSMIAIFLIPSTYLVVNYSIDVGNSLSYSIADGYSKIFQGRDMYYDAKCTIRKACAGNPPDRNDNAIIKSETPPTNGGTSGDFTTFEQMNHETREFDPCQGIDNTVVPNEEASIQRALNRMGMNMSLMSLSMSWNIMCAFQIVYLYYLWCMGPIVAALWVWPMDYFQKALPSWLEGVITISIWGFFWNTVILVMALCRNVSTDVSATCFALTTLANSACLCAFSFTSLINQAATACAQLSQSLQQGGGGGGGGQQQGSAAGGQTTAGAQGSRTPGGTGQTPTGGTSGGTSGGGRGSAQPSVSRSGSTNNATFTPVSGGTSQTPGITTTGEGGTSDNASTTGTGRTGGGGGGGSGGGGGGDGSGSGGTQVSGQSNPDVPAPPMQTPGQEGAAGSSAAGGAGAAGMPGTPQVNDMATFVHEHGEHGGQGGLTTTQAGEHLMQTTDANSEMGHYLHDHPEAAASVASYLATHPMVSEDQLGQVLSAHPDANVGQVNAALGQYDAASLNNLTFSGAGTPYATAVDQSGMFGRNDSVGITMPEGHSGGPPLSQVVQPPEATGSISHMADVGANLINSHAPPEEIQSYLQSAMLASAKAHPDNPLQGEMAFKNELNTSIAEHGGSAYLDKADGSSLYKLTDHDHTIAAVAAPSEVPAATGTVSHMAEVGANLINENAPPAVVQQYLEQAMTASIQAHPENPQTGEMAFKNQLNTMIAEKGGDAYLDKVSGANLYALQNKQGQVITEIPVPPQRPTT